MDNEKVEKETPENQEEQEITEEVVEDNPADNAEEVVVENKDLKSALAQKEHFREKAEKLEAELNSIQQKQEEVVPTEEPAPKTGLDVEDYIDISASLEGLDEREKGKLAQEHKLTGKSLKEIRESEDFQLWQSAYQSKTEKEKALNPSFNQGDVDRPKTLQERLAEAKTSDEKEQILVEAGLYKESRKRNDKTNIDSN